MKKLVLTILALSSFTASAAPEQFKNISELMDKYNDYPTYNLDGKEFASFKVLSQKPLHIQISPRTLAGSTDKDIKYESDKASVYAAYRTLFQTPAESVTVTVLPLSITPQPRKIEYLAAKKFDYKITKKQASNLLSKNCGIVNSEQLMRDDGEWSEAFEKSCYMEDGKPGLSKFTRALISQG
ncbi:hypothetical protein HG548_18475 [Citrobacter sp. DNRA3]|uniref:hypothetical protein n=1 Tax=Citrobacter sp. DNRA3 TaxID=2723054 RepID=UPI0014594851|nr:hypothetical protein [Citrobacter sp. DNRA3]NBJ29628.1 hypothetical protein [Citrobacter freundii]NMD76516.1 hypothetical protein [Citrobacter sp. DNRA3]